MALRSCHYITSPFSNSVKLTNFRPRNCRFSVQSCLADNSYSRKLVLQVKEKLERDYPSLPVGKNGRDDEEMILWFLKDRDFSVDRAVDKLTKTIQWRRDFRVSELNEESVKDVLATGKSFVHDSLDKNGRPVLIVVASKHIPAAHKIADDQKLCVLHVEQALSKLPPGQEQILGIVDLKGFSTANADLQFLTFLFDVFYYYYPKRLGEVLFVDSPFVFKPFWELVKPLVKSYASLVKFCSTDTIRKEYFTAETLPDIFRR